MSRNQPETLTYSAMLVIWGQFAQSIGLIDKIQSVLLHQKAMSHSPQRKVLEFLVAWKAESFSDFPYPLDVALERFHTGRTLRHGTLIHFECDPVTTDLPGWFQRYNVCQLIEAGIKEGKTVFAMHHLKVRSAPAIFLQEQLAVFTANFVRWAARWLTEQCPQIPTRWQKSAHPKVKEQVKVAAHTSAWLVWQDQGCLIMFTDHSLFVGWSL